MDDDHSLAQAVPKDERRVQAVLALFRGEAAPQVAQQYQMSRSALSKFPQRALTAIRHALADHHRGPRQPHNRLAGEREAQGIALCQRHPTWSSYRVQKRYGTHAPSPRPMQRVRHRHGIVRLSKRAPATRPARRLTPEILHRATAIVRAKPTLGPERIAWDLQNGDHLTVSPSTMKRLKRTLHEAPSLPPPPPPVWRFSERHHPHSLWHGDCLEKGTRTDLDQTAYHLTLLDDYARGYVFCDLVLNPDIRTTIRALITAMRQWRVIPQAVVFDNGSPFKGTLLSAFCAGVGVRLLHTTVHHPQTNGQLERAFRDDMREFYRLYDTWVLERLRKDVPGYVHYRNTIRGHRALRGQPAITRLNECASLALPELLDGLESSACYEVRHKVIPHTGSIRLFGRDAFLGESLAGVDVTFFESVEGLEARLNGQCVAVLRDYRTFRQMAVYGGRDIPPMLHFEPCQQVICPPIADAQ